MRLKKLIIYGYGKWVDTEFDLDASIQVFYGQNEAGKSTLMSFIQSILFGFPMRHSSSLRYEPKESSRYGGRLIVTDDRFGEVSIERVNGKVTGDVTVTFEDGTQGDERLLDTLLNHKNRQFFESIYAFNLKGVEETSEMNREQFTRFFLSVGSFGNESFLKKADHYQQKASQLFKPTGRKPKLNQLYQSLQKQKVQLSKAKESNEQYVLLIKEKEGIHQRINELEQTLKEKTKENEELQHLLKNIETINEINDLKKEIDHYPPFDLPEDGLIHLNHINKQLEDLREQTKGLYEEQKRLQDKYRPSKDLLIYQENEEAVNQLLNNWDQLELKVELLKESQQTLSHLEKQSFEFKLRESLPLNESLPKKLSPADRNEVYSYEDDLKKLKDERNDLKEKLQVLEVKMGANDERIDTIEQSLWTASKYKEAEEQEKILSSPVTKNPGLIKTPAFIYATGIALTATLYLITQSFTVFLLIPVMFILAARVRTLQSPANEQEGSPYERSDFYHQKSLREQWKDALASNDVFQQETNEITHLLNINTEKLHAINEQFFKWKETNHYPRTYEIETVLSTLNQLNELRKIEDLRENEQTKVNRELNALEDELKQNAYAQLFFEDGRDTLSVFSEVRRSIRQIETDKRLQQSYIKETDKLQNSILYYIQQEKEQVKLKNELFVSGGVKTEDAFVSAYQKLSEKNEKIKRYERLKETINLDKSDNDKYTVNGLKENIDEVTAVISQVQNQQKEWTKKTIEIDYKINDLEEGGIYSDLLQKYENEKSLYQEVADEWSTYKVASALIEHTLENAKENQLPQTLKLAEKYFRSITSNQYVAISLEENEFYVVDKSGSKWQASELSRGTVEPLYIAIRLAFVVNNKEHVQFPVIIDDSFVNIDEHRKNSLYELLTEISQSVQLIYFTFDETTLGYIDEEHVIKLDYIK
ncbi:MAG: AAA family ATPase [Alkalibacterium sp.]|nr:AAA family ATPase [Alkalibacterium sp.]